ncbi:MAG: zinc-ribbon domain-containing protein [Lachnospiraceae bacterium]|nr:zinc-ribbon domain-containing protein [Lachnospiraceae bacterium]
MAGFMDSVNKGLATLNVKTSNLMETSKFKTAISSKESEIAALKKVIGETVYLNRNNFSMDMIQEQISAIEEKYAAIEDIKKQISELEEKEKNILGAGATHDTAKIFCSQCGAPNEAGSKFCEKCGSKLEQ